MDNASETCIGSIDQGTTSTRFIIFDKQGRPIASHQIEFTQHHPHPGWHEQDAYEILASVNTCIDEAVSKFEAGGRNRASIRTIGLTNQRETTVVWDRSTGEALCRAVAWPDTRTAALVRELKVRPGAGEVADACGLPFSTYPSAVKLIWLLRNNGTVAKAYADGRLAFGTVDTWLLYKLSRGAPPDRGSDGGSDGGGSDAEDRVQEELVFVTDATNASRTMLVDLETLEYRRASIEFFELDPDRIALPRIVPSADARAFGRLAGGALRGTPVTGCLGDQSAALVGQRAFEPGAAKNTYGTGCFMLCNVGARPVRSTHGLLSTVAYHFGEGRPPAYALEGSIAVAGSGVRFLAHNLGFADSAAAVTELASEVDDSGGCVFVTAFSGLFAPYWIDSARGTIFGLSQHTQKGHLARAVLEAACFQTKAIRDAMEKDSGHRLGQLAVDGGMSSSDLCMQTQADLLGRPVERPAMRETTSLGAAIAAGFAAHIWRDFAELESINQDNRTLFQPQLSAEEADCMFQRWERAVAMCSGWLSDAGSDS